MKRNILAIMLAVASLITTMEGKAQTSDRLVPFADPYILLDNGVYYAYGTHGRNGIEVYISNNLKSWHHGGLALHKRDSYGEKWFWAPEVYNINGKYYMFYTAQERTCVAVADSPIGPFKQVEKVPFIADHKNIDNTLFIDDDGTPYMFWVRVGKVFKICVAELNSDLMSLKDNNVTTCISAKQPWEKVLGRVNEGPSVIKHKGTYYMLYSGNGYHSHNYGVGCATAKSVRGRWTKYDNNPLLQRVGDLVGVGHGAPFKDKHGRWCYVFHAHHSKEQIHPRKMYITRMSFRNGELHLSPKYFTPIVVD